MSDAILLQYVEIDLTRCSLTYGTAPCTAEIGVTGDFKCYNSPATCQDPANYSADAKKTFRYAISTQDLPVTIDCRPNINAISIRPQEIKPAESMGSRESVTVNFQNHRDGDSGYDKYISERGFNPYNKGTHWGKFVARWPNLQGYPLRIIRGVLGQAINEMETRHYYIEDSSGPDINGKFSITAKDALKFLDGKKAEAPLVSTGVLHSAIDESDTSLTLSPAGVGDLEYPASGTASIGDEVVTFTRSSDNVTLTGRGLHGSEQGTHDEGETFQIAIVYSGEDPADIIDDLIFNYTDTPTTYRNLSNWLVETENFYGRLLSGTICKPTPVKNLIDELIEQVGLVFFADVINQKLILRVLGGRVSILSVTDENHIAGTIRFSADEEKRVNVVSTYYGQKNPLLNLDEGRNYSSISVLYDDDQVKALENLPLSIKRINSRWISTANSPAADEINEATIRRVGDTPGKLSFRLPLGHPISLGDPITVRSKIFEDSQGDMLDPQQAIITRVSRHESYYDVVATMFRFRPVDVSTGRVVLVDANVYNINLRAEHDLIYTTPSSGDQVTLIISPGVIIGSGSTSSPALSIGDWPSGVAVAVINNGTIVARGGAGGNVTTGAGLPGGVGGTALYTRYAISLTNDGIIGGGGGGGGSGGYGGGGNFGLNRSGGGGGGAAFGAGGGDPGTAPFYGGTDGALLAGGAGGDPGLLGGLGGDGGDGGDLGQAGLAGETFGSNAGGAGGAAGSAIDGDSFVTYVTAGDIRGAQVN